MIPDWEFNFVDGHSVHWSKIQIIFECLF